MALERDGKYIRGTASEIAAYREAYRDQQFAKNVSNAAAAGAAVIAVAGVAAVVAMVNASRTAKMQLENYMEFYELLRPDLAETIFEKARRSAWWGTFLIIAVSIVMGAGLSIPLAFATDAGPMAFIPLGVFAIMGIFGAKTTHSTGELKYLSSKGMRITYEAVCPHCYKKTLVIGYGMCRKCFGFLSEQNRQDIIGLDDVPLPEVIGKTRLTGPQGMLVDNFLTTELKATYSLSWLRPIYCILPVFAAVAGFIGVGVFLSNRPYTWPIPLMIGAGVAAFIAAYLHAVYKETFNKDVERYCDSVVSPKPLPFDAILNPPYNPATAATTTTSTATTKINAHAKPKSKSYKPLAWAAFGVYSLFLTMLVVSVILNNDAATGFSILLLPVCITLGIIAIVKRKKYKVKSEEKAKFNIFALLTLIPIAAPVFAILSAKNKQYSSLSKHVALWIAATQIAFMILMITLIIFDL